MRLFANIFLYVIISVLYWWFGNNVSVFSITPNLLFIAAVASAIIARPLTALSFCFFWGLHMDISGSNAFGAYALVYTLMCYAVHVMKRHFDFDSIVPQVILAFILSILTFLFYQFLSVMFSTISPQRLKILLIEPFVNALLIPIGFLIFRYLKRKFGCL